MQRGWIGAALAGGVFLVIGGIGGAQAQSAGDADVISFGGGWYDLNDDDDAMDLRIEYRPGVTYFGFVKPWVGIEVTSDGALFGAAGVLADINLTPNIVLTPSLGAGLYSNGGGKDLGRAIQFRSQIELGYRFGNGSRLGIAISHISNAELGDVNPGTEVATVYYHLPVGNLFGN